MKELYYRLNMSEKLIQEVLAEYEKQHLSRYIPAEAAILYKGYQYFLLFLREALLFDSIRMFQDNVQWFIRTNARRPVIQQMIAEVLEKMKEDMRKLQDEKLRYKAVDFIETARQQLILPADLPGSYFEQPGADSSLCRCYLEKLKNADEAGARQLIMSLAADLADIKKLYTAVLQPVQYEIGRMWEKGEISVAEEHFYTEITRRVVSLLVPAPDATQTKQVFLGLCVEGERHSLGIQMVCDHFALNGWKTVFMGADVPSDDELLVAAAKYQACAIGIAVTMPYYLHKAAELIRAIRACPALASTTIIAGGFVFNNYPEVTKIIGADGYARNGEEAVALCRRS